MKTQTKCTISLCTLFLIELLPIPFTGIYSIYAIRKRPRWVLRTIERLYADAELDPEKILDAHELAGHDHLKTRRNCTIGIITLFLIDVIVPVIVPLGIYISRKRPNWFKNVSARLYADQYQEILWEMDNPVDTQPTLAKRLLTFNFKGA